MKIYKVLLEVVVSLLVFVLGPAAAALSQSTSWEVTFGGSRVDMGFSVQQTTDGGSVLLGITAPKGMGQVDSWLIKTDSSGN